MDNWQLIAVMVGDLHIGKIWKSNCTPMTRDKLTDAYWKPLEELQEKYSGSCALFSLGDWFDKSHNNEKDIVRSYNHMQKFCGILAGNHDILNRAEETSSLQLLSMLQGGEGSVVEFAVPGPEKFNKPTYFSVGLGLYGRDCEVMSVPHHPTQEVFEQAIDLAIRSNSISLSKPPTTRILMLHCNYSSGAAGKPDSDLYLTPELQKKAEAAFDLIFLGHEHLPVRSGKVIVAGSTQPCNFGELGPRFFWEVYFDRDSKALKTVQVPIQSALTHLILDVSDKGNIHLPEKCPDLVLLKGRVPISEAKDLQLLVKKLYELGALAVKLDVEFDKGVITDAGEVTGAMQNAIEVVQAEIEGNHIWAELLQEVLQTIQDPYGDENAAELRTD